MTGPKPDPRDVETRPISVAELLAKNGNIGAPPPAGRRRRRRGNADAVTVAELTGEIPIIRDDDAAPEPDAPASGALPISEALPVGPAPGFVDDDRPPTGPRPAERPVERPAEPRWPKSPQQATGGAGPQQSAYPRPVRRSEQPAPGQDRPAEARPADDGPRPAESAMSAGSGAERMRPDPVDSYADLGADLGADAIDTGVPGADSPVEDSAFIRSYLNPADVSLDRSIRPLRRAGRDDDRADDLEGSDRAESGHGYADHDDHDDHDDRDDRDDRDDYDDRGDYGGYGDHGDYEDGPVGPPGVVGGALVVLQSILAVVFGGGLFIAFDQLWRWNSIVALVLTVLVTLGLVTAVQVVRKTPDVVSTLIAVAVGLLVTLGPLALHAG